MKPMKWTTDRMMPGFSTWIDDFFGDDDRWLRGWKGMTVPAVNIEETETEIRLEVAVPGMNKEDFTLSVDKGMLTVSAETSTDEKEEEDNYRRREFNFTSFKRSFWVPESVDVEKIIAKYESGLLKITLPKFEHVVERNGKSIKIQ